MVQLSKGTNSITTPKKLPKPMIVPHKKLLPNGIATLLVYVYVIVYPDFFVI
jgi:hypothetical protein